MFLGIDPVLVDAGESVFPCERRAQPFGSWFRQVLISTVSGDALVHSVAPEFAADLAGIAAELPSAISDEALFILDDFFVERIRWTLLRVDSYARMTVESRDFRDRSEADVEVTALEENPRGKELFFSLLGRRGRKFKEMRWQNLREPVSQGRYFVVLSDGEIASWAAITDIDFGGGNIAVSTRAEYRKKGYGRACVAKATDWCIENDLLPIYLVAESNEPSVRLAESLGFEIRSREIVVMDLVT
jgi:GNAT superfamily N-acetyltransferase